MAFGAARIVRGPLCQIFSDMENHWLRCSYELALSLQQKRFIKRKVLPPKPREPIQVNLQEAKDFDPEDLFSPAVQQFIRSRQLENKGGRQAAVTSFASGEPKGVIELNDFVFAANPRIDILHRVVVWQRAEMRAGTASTKDRSEVRGSGRKMRPQKGTGKARQGDRKAPHWRGGGVAHGPKPRDWGYALPMKVRRMGLRVALSCRLAQGDLHIVEDFEDILPYEEDLQLILERRGWTNSCLIDGLENPNLVEASRSLEQVSISHAQSANVLDILKRHKLILSLNAVRRIEETLVEDNRIITDPLYYVYKEMAITDDPQ